MRPAGFSPVNSGMDIARPHIAKKKRRRRILFASGGALALIALGRSAGFSLDEIALMFAPDGRPRINRRMLTAKAEELDRTIRELTEMRDGLRHAAACRAPSHMECPTFRRILRAAASGAFRPQRQKSLTAVQPHRRKPD